MATIKLVQGDTRPQIIVDLTDEVSGLPIDVSGATVRMKFRAAGETEIIATLVATLLPGLADEDGVVSEGAPYDTPGVGGRVVFGWSATPDALTGEPGNYEGEIEVTFADATVQTVWEPLKFKLREDF